MYRLAKRPRRSTYNYQMPAVADTTTAPVAGVIDYADETPLVRAMFADALARHGLQPRMDEVYATELPNLPPKAA